MQEQDSPYYVVDPTTGCWLWQRTLRAGYGRMRRGQRLVSAHVWFWEQENGPVPEGMVLDHMCHNADLSCRGGMTCVHRRCVNPAHLEPASRAVNVRRGRSARLSPEQVEEIKEQHQVSPKVLAATYGVTREMISVIRAGRAWGDIGTTHEKRVPLGPPQVQRVVLTEQEEAEIRAAPRHYGSGRELAHRYGVSDALISRTRLGGNDLAR